MRRLDAVSNAYELWSEAVLDLGRLDLFSLDVQRATHVNSSPYVVDFARLEARFGASPGRRRKLAVLRGELDAAARVGVEVSALLVGGSFLDLAKPEPKDLDCAVFYATDVEDAAAELVAAQGRLRAGGVDARFFPTDISPLLTIKVAAFFTALYAARREGAGPPKGCLLVTPPETAAALRAIEPTSETTAGEGQ